MKYGNNHDSIHEDTLRYTMLMDDGKWGRREQGDIELGTAAPAPKHAPSIIGVT